jgi:hypothetical protein
MSVRLYGTLTELLGSDQAFNVMLSNMTVDGYGSLDGVFAYTHWTDTAHVASATRD